MSIALPYSGLGRALHDPGDLAELASHLGYHLSADTADGLHREATRRGTASGPPMKRPARTQALSRLKLAGTSASSRPVVEPSKRTSAASAAEPIAYPLDARPRRVPDRVQRIGDRANGTRPGNTLGHLGDTARVVGHRTVGVERDDQAGHGEEAGPSRLRRSRNRPVNPFAERMRQRR